MKVCILTSVHMAFDSRIFHRQAKSLVKAGYDVTLIAQTNVDQVVDKINIIALPKPKNRLYRIVGTWRVFRLAYIESADIYHFHDPELIPVGLLLTLLRRGKVIYDVHEDYPKTILYKHWIPSPIKKPVSWTVNFIEKSSASHLDCIIAVIDIIAQQFKGKRIHTIENYPILGNIQTKSEYNFASPTLIYVGGLTEERGISDIVQAMEYIESCKNVKLILCGKFTPEAFEKKVKSLRGFEKVEHLGWIDPTNIPSKLAQATIGIACLHPEPNYVRKPTTKVFEYMAAGLPTVASNFPKWKEFIENSKCGLTVNPLDPREIAWAIEYLLEHPSEARKMGENGRKAVLEKYNWENESKKLLAVYEDLLQVKDLRQ